MFRPHPPQPRPDLPFAFLPSPHVCSDAVDAICFRIRTYGKRARNPLRIRTSKTQHLKPFRMNTYKKTGEGGPTTATQTCHPESTEGSAIRRQAPSRFPLFTTHYSLLTSAHRDYALLLDFVLFHLVIEQPPVDLEAVCSFRFVAARIFNGVLNQAFFQRRDGFVKWKR